MVDFQPGLLRHATGFQGWYVCSGLQPSSATGWEHWGIHLPRFWGWGSQWLSVESLSGNSPQPKKALIQGHTPLDGIPHPMTSHCGSVKVHLAYLQTGQPIPVAELHPHESTGAFFVFSTKFSSPPYQFPLPSFSDRCWFLSHSLVHFQPANPHLRICLPENNLRQMILQGLLFPPQCFH